MLNSSLKPWPNGVASRRKLKTWVYLRLRLARHFLRLRWLALTCVHFGRDQICTQIKASFSLFGHPTQVNASWVTSIILLLANECLKMFFCAICVSSEETCECVRSPNASLPASSTCVHLRLLAGPFDQNLRWANEKTITELGYRKILWFVSISQTTYLSKPKDCSLHKIAIFC